MDHRHASPPPCDDTETAGVATAGDDAAAQPDRDRADRLADKIALPVLIAALASIPAVMLTLFDDPYQSFGEGLNTLSGAVLIAETLVLFAVSERRWEWIKRNKFLVGLTIAIIPAIVFAVGPVQLLRLIRVVGALRIIRVGRIMKAGKIVQERAGLDRKWQRAIGVGATVLCAAFVAVVLADPTSEIWQFGDPDSEVRQSIDAVLGNLGWIGVAVAGVILFGATYIVVANRKRDARDAPDKREAQDARDTRVAEDARDTGVAEDAGDAERADDRPDHG